MTLHTRLQKLKMQGTMMKKIAFLFFTFAANATFTTETDVTTKKSFFESTMFHVYHLTNDNYFHASRVSDALKTFLNSLELLPHMLGKHNDSEAEAYLFTLQRYCILCIETYEIKSLNLLPVYQDQWKTLLVELERLVEKAGAQGLVHAQDEMRRIRVFSFLDYLK